MAALTLAAPRVPLPPGAGAVPRLAARPWAEEFYLAGSAALALYTGHRPVTDLDLMSNANRLDQPGPARPARRAAGRSIRSTAVETARDGYLSVRLAGGAVGLRLFYYPYPLVRAVRGDLAGLAVASAADLGLMKLGAIISRGSRRDFVDLYLLCRELPLADPPRAARRTSSATSATSPSRR